MVGGKIRREIVEKYWKIRLPGQRFYAGNSMYESEKKKPPKP